MIFVIWNLQLPNPALKVWFPPWPSQFKSSHLYFLAQRTSPSLLEPNFRFYDAIESALLVNAKTDFYNKSYVYLSILHVLFQIVGFGFWRSSAGINGGVFHRGFIHFICLIQRTHHSFGPWRYPCRRQSCGSWRRHRRKDRLFPSMSGYGL